MNAKKTRARKRSGVAVHDLGPHIESLFRQMRDSPRRRDLVQRLKGSVLEHVRPQVDTWPITDDAIVILSRGHDTKGKRVPGPMKAYFQVLGYCVHIEESADWNPALEQGLIRALDRCAAEETLERSTAKLRADIGKFRHYGRSPGSVGKTHKAMAKVLTDPKMTDAALLRKLGWSVYGDTIEAPDREISMRTFANKASAIRRKLLKPKK